MCRLIILFWQPIYVCFRTIFCLKQDLGKCIQLVQLYGYQVHLLHVTLALYPNKIHKRCSTGVQLIKLESLVCGLHTFNGTWII